MELLASSPLRVIRARPDHIDLVAPLFDSYRQFYNQAPDLERARRFILERLENQDSVIFLAMQGSSAAGFTQLYPTFSSISMKPLWILNDLFVAPQARRLGAASALLERARELAQETGAAGMVLETAKDNPAQYLYEKMGWKRDEIFYTYYLNV